MRKSAIAVAALALFLAGCGKDDSPDVVQAHYKQTDPDCLAALNDADNALADTQRLEALAAQYPQLIPHAYNAGYDRTIGGLQGVLSGRKDLDRQLADLTKSIQGWADRYNLDKSRCPGL